MDDAVVPLGAWSDERDALAQASFSVNGQATILPDLEKFGVRVASAIQTFRKIPAVDTSGQCIFVMVSSAQQLELKNAKLSFQFGMQSGTVPLMGRIHYVTSAVSAACSEPCPSDDAEMMARICELGLGVAPTIIYRPQAPAWRLTLHSNGLSGDDCSEVFVNDGDVSEAAICGALNAIYEHELVTPDAVPKGQVKFWSDAGKGHPIPDTESALQQFVKVALISRFWWCKVTQEQPAKVGRTDVEILENSATQGLVAHHAVLELKVLRSFGSTGSAVAQSANDEAIVKGLKQAHVYGKDRNTALKLLCCFDMRDADVGDEATFLAISADAKTLAVLPKRWFLYRNSDDYRRALTSADLIASSGSTSG